MKLGTSVSDSFFFPKTEFIREVSEIEASSLQRAIDGTLHYIITGMKKRWVISYIYPKTDMSIVNLPKLRMWRALNLKLLDKDNVWYDVAIVSIGEEIILKGKWDRVNLVLEQA